MCRLLGIVSSAPVDFRVLLADRAHSLASLGAEHRDGWGMAAFSSGEWSIHKGTRPATHDPRFHRRASTLRGDVLVSHVRKRTVGATREENTHPFARGGWVFAHNGTVTDRSYLREQVSERRSAEISGDTDSELLFAFVLTRLDEMQDPSQLDSMLLNLVRECRARVDFGSFNFLLSDGARCYVHRFGRSLFLLERGTRSQSPSLRANAVFVASEPMTNESWREIEDGTLLRIDREPMSVTVL